MKTLTVWQPWCSLIMAGAKRFEFRRWPAHRAIIGQRIVIHAAIRPVQHRELLDLQLRLKMGYSALDANKAVPIIEGLLDGSISVQLGVGLGTAILGKPRRAGEIFTGKVQIADSDRIARHLWAWPLDDVRDFPEPVPCRGFQGFWTWPFEVAP